VSIPSNATSGAGASSGRDDQDQSGRRNGCLPGVLRIPSVLNWQFPNRKAACRGTSPQRRRALVSSSLADISGQPFLPPFPGFFRIWGLTVSASLHPPSWPLLSAPRPSTSITSPASSILIRWVGRVRLQVLGFIGCAAGLFLASLSLGTEGGTKMFCIFAGFMLFSFMTNMGPNAMTCLIAGEVFPTHIRGKGAGFAASFAKERPLIP